MIQLDTVNNNSTDVTGLVSIVLSLLPRTVTTDQHTRVESLTGLVQNVTASLAMLVTSSQENNRTLTHLCQHFNHCKDYNPSSLSILVLLIPLGLILVGCLIACCIQCR